MIAEALIGEMKHEAATTRRLLERVPEGKLAWKPHQKSTALGHLALHVAQLPRWTVEVVSRDEMDLAGYTPPPLPTSTAEILAVFDDSVAKVLEKLQATPDAAFGGTWRLRMGEQVIFELPKMAVIRSLAFNHLVHHRGQLSVYLRLLDVPVPQIYGPSADEP